MKFEGKDDLEPFNVGAFLGTAFVSFSFVSFSFSFRFIPNRSSFIFVVVSYCFVSCCSFCSSFQ